MKFFIVFACLIAAASAVPLLAPAATTYHTSHQSIVPVGQTVHSTVVSQPIVTKTYAAPIAYGHGAVLGAPLAAAPLGYGLGHAGLGLGHGLYGAPLAAAPLAYGHAGLGYGHGLYGAPLAAPLALGYGHGGYAKGIY